MQGVRDETRERHVLAHNAARCVLGGGCCRSGGLAAGPQDESAAHDPAVLQLHEALLAFQQRWSAVAKDTKFGLVFETFPSGLLPELPNKQIEQTPAALR